MTALQLLGETLRAWRLSHVGWALFVGVATLFANGTPLSNPQVDFQVLNALAYNVLQFGFPLVLLLGWAHRLVDARRLAPLPAYVGVVVLEVPLGVWVIGPALQPLLGSVPWWTTWNDIVLMCSTLFWHGLGVAVVAQRHLSQRAEAVRLQVEEASAERRRRLAATRLLALQARVDPPLLFERLQRIDTELQSDPALARRRLDALIDLLRALQPHAQASSSTLGRELDAAEAYARVVSRSVQGPERLQLAVPETLRELPMAPLVLLPLLRALLAEPAGLWQLHGSGRQLELAGLGPDADTLQRAAAQVDLPALSERLAAVLGPAANLRLDPQAALPRFLLNWPP